MLDVKKLLTKLCNRQVQRIVVESSSFTMAGDARSYVDLNTGLPNNAVIISMEVYSLPNQDWVRVTPMLASETVIRCRYHNEYSGSLTGKIGLRVAYYLT